MKLSRAFFAAVFGAAALVLQSPRDPHTWFTAVSIVLAAASAGPQKAQKHPGK